MSDQIWLETVGTRLKDERVSETRIVRLAIAVEKFDNNKESRSIAACKLIAGDFVRMAQPDFRPVPDDETFELVEIQKPDDSKLIRLTGVPIFHDGAIYELR